MTQLVMLPTKSAISYPSRTNPLQAQWLQKIAEPLKTNCARDSEPTL
jgi:hypothetical protein